MFSYGLAVLFGFLLGFFAEDINLYPVEAVLVSFGLAILITLMNNDINTYCKKFFRRIFSL
ncbi:MAG: hypothetical protein PHX25_01060 [Candidatus Pacebacteria bacterium]|nr:hypothetical protein [Candidatus Paceibacterota bacterium]